MGLLVLNKFIKPLLDMGQSVKKTYLKNNIAIKKLILLEYSNIKNFKTHILH
jgi:hypothetical protein